MFNVRYNAPSPNRRYKALREPESRYRIMKAARDAVIEKLGGWIFRRSTSRHKTAQRLGAPTTGILEFTATSPTSTSRGGGKIFGRRRGDNASIFISGVPFIQKAFRDLHVSARRARYLTIPVHRDAVRTKAREIERKGWDTFIPRGGRVIMGKKDGSSRAVPLYVLRKSVKIPRDHNLLPASHLMDLWMKKAIQEELSR